MTALKLEDARRVIRGEDFFADKDLCSIVLEVLNSALGAKGGSRVGAHANAR